MWIITPRGFYSAVNDPDKRGTVKVRSRVREDLESLCELAPMRRYADRIETSRFTDYAFRIYVKKRHWNRALKLLGKEITYGNHKDAVKAQQGQERASVYSQVWWDLLALQEPRGHGDLDWESKPDDMLKARATESLLPEPDLLHWDAEAWAKNWAEEDAVMAAVRDCQYAGPSGTCDGQTVQVFTEGKGWSVEPCLCRAKNTAGENDDEPVR